MRQPLQVRLKALLLATILVAGGIALPAYDAAVYHSGRPLQHGPVRFEPADQGTAHILLCALGPQFNRTRSVVPGGPETPIPCAKEPDRTPLPQAVAPATAPATLQRSRAPPEPAA